MNELKTIWDKGTDLHASNSRPAEMILTDKNNPLAMIEKKTWIAFGIFPFVALLFAGTFFKHPLVRHSLAMWWLFAILFAEFVFTIFNLMTLRKMNDAQGSIRENLGSRIKMLSERFQLFLQIYISLYLLMVILLEITMYYHLDSLFDGWAHVSILIRAFTYIAVLTFIYLAKRSSQNKHYGVYLQQLRKVAEQIK